MGTQLDWQIGEDEETLPQQRRRRFSPYSWTALLLVAVVALVLGVLWQAGRERARRAELLLEQEVQELLDRQGDALHAGDGELFFSFFTPDAGWRMSQLRSEYQVAFRAGLMVTRVTARGNEIWANVTWREGGGTLQRVLFLQRQGNSLLLAPSGTGYWQSRHRQIHVWGNLSYSEIDEEWASAIAAFVQRTESELCARGCRRGQFPFTLAIATDLSGTAAPNEVRVPSPRLLALTEDGEPGALFWDYLRAALQDYLTPAIIRYGVPDDLVVNFEELVPLFEKEHPGLSVDILPFSSLPREQIELLDAVDGLYLVPEEDLLAAGLVADLTDFYLTDPDFDQVDLYEQVWQGGWWQGRLWLMPQSAILPVIYYDRSMYERTGMHVPSLRWTWDEMRSDIMALDARREDDTFRWAFLDEGRRTLYSFAYGWQAERCRNDVSGCRQTLSLQATTAAYEWFAAISDHMPEVWWMTDYERANLVRTQVAFRKIAVWTSKPVHYELEVQRSTLGVVPFPGSDRFDGVTPLDVQGSIISRSSERPLATWRWLSFLTYQPVAQQRRQVPVRPSVARDSGYWTGLPQPLDDVMRTAFPFARAISLGERDLFSWENIAGVVTGSFSPVQAAQSAPTLYWFTLPETSAEPSMPSDGAGPLRESPLPTNLPGNPRHSKDVDQS